MSMFKKNDIRQKYNGEPRGLFGKSDKQRAESYKAYEDEQAGRYVQPKSLQTSETHLLKAAQKYLPAAHDPATPSLSHVGGQLKAPMAVYDFEPLEAFSVPEPPQSGLQRPRIHLPD